MPGAASTRRGSERRRAGRGHGRRGEAAPRDLSSSPPGLRSELRRLRSCLQRWRSSSSISRRSCTTTSSTRRRSGVACRRFTSPSGRDRALVVGDSLIVAAFEVLRRCAPPPCRGLRRLPSRTLSKGAQLCCLGQLEELDPRATRSEKQYLESLRRRPDRSSPSRRALGALIAGAGDEELAALAAFGTELGTAYQIRDDLCDGSSAPERFSPTHATYAQAVAGVHAALDCVPPSCTDALSGLAAAMLDARRYLNGTVIGPGRRR